MVGSRRLIDLSGGIAAGVGRALAEDSRTVLVALSGGADSSVLAWAIAHNTVSARAVHIHHGWPHSDRLANAAERVAKHLGLAFSVRTIDTSEAGSPEAVARAARYEALELDRARDEVVATGHTQTDQAETVIGNLMWGSGIDGLQAIRRRTGGLVRPLLDASRTDVRELAVLLALPFADDPANENPRYRRVRIRRALTAWEADLAPGVTARLASTADLVGDDIDVLERLAGEALIESGDNGVRLASGVLRSMEPTVGRRVVRRALRVANGGSPGSRPDVEAVVAVAAGGSAREISGGHRVERVGAYVHISLPDRRSDSMRLEWSVPGIVHHSGWSWTAAAYAGTPDVFPLSRWTQVFDASLFDHDPASLRALRDGDRLAIRGGHKRARDAVAEAHVPPSEREDLSVLEVGDELVWVPGVRRADVGWVSASTARYLVISAEREGRWKPVES